MKIGILGNGQLARMLALAGKPLGLDFIFYSANPDGCADVLGDTCRGELHDLETLRSFITQVDIITFENENIPQATMDAIPADKIFPPSQSVLIAQDRLLEKQFINKLAIKLPRYWIIESESDLQQALQDNNKPLVLKTRRDGYDGKGQARIHTENDIQAAWSRLKGQQLIAESLVDFNREVSVVATRSHSGEINFYPITENVHQDGILRTSTVLLNDPVQEIAEDYARRLMEALDYVGTLSFEFFDCGGELFANEFAPRVHNSGHWSIDGATCSQFENHLRAICKLPLGYTQAQIPSIMVNIIGQFPQMDTLLGLPNTHLHDYQKQSRPGRKVGHLTICDHHQENQQSTLAAISLLIDKP